MRLFIDTSAYVALKRGHEGVMELVRSAESLHLSVVVLGELLFGFHGGNRLDENLAELEEFLRHPLVTMEPLKFSTADRFGRVANALKRAGNPMPTNDVWIAAHALDLGADLLTLDTHFEWVAGLVVRNPGSAGRSKA